MVVNPIIKNSKQTDMRKIILLFCVIITILPGILLAQSRVITGTVRDIQSPLPGVSVAEKGLPGNGAVTDPGGKFKVTLKGSSNVLIFRFLGYVTRELNVSGKNEGMDVTLSSDNQALDEVVIVGYGKTSRITNTGSVSTINATEIRNVPTANVQNALTGKLPGFFSQQSSGQPGKDASDFFIRGVSSLNPAGNKPLIIVDDVEYSYDQLQQININEISSISVLKDASSTAIYGIKGANGVLVVTTRRGKLGKPQINVRVESGAQSPTKIPKFLDAYQSASLINQAQSNDGQTPEFTQADLDLYKNGTDPYGHPNVNWYDEIFKKYSFQENTNLDISGGNETVKYFISAGALNQNGLVRSFPDPRGDVNTNYNFKRYNFRSNLDLKANKTLSMRLDVTTRFSTTNSPNVDAASALSEVFDFGRLTPFTSPLINPDGTYAYAYSHFNSGHLPTLNARLATGGYQNAKRTDYNIVFNTTQQLDILTQGLSLTARVAYSSQEQYTRGTGNYGAIPSYHYDPANKSYQLNPAGTYVFPNIFYSGNTNIYTNNVNLQLFSNYDRTFNSKHHVSGLILVNQQSQTFNAYPFLDPASVGVPAKFQGVSMSGNYEYDGKYLLDLKAAYNGTDRFSSNHRFGMFPAIGIGYNLSREKFFKEAFPVFGLFKIRGSYGLVGSDVAPNNRYIYAQNYLQNGNNYQFGESPTGYRMFYEGSLANSNVVWEKQKETNIGIDLNLLKDNRLSATIDVFRNTRYDQLIVPNNVPDIIGIGLPAVNVGRTQNQGFDGQIGYHGSTGNVQWGANFVFSYAKNKILYQSEASPAYPWLARTGQPLNQPFGYHSLGYYTADDISSIQAYQAGNGGSNANNKSIAVPDNGLPLHAGDLKYQDLNGDGFINVFDQRAIGRPNLANTNLGLNLQASYKGFSASILLQGSFNYSFIITGTGIEPFIGQFQPIHLEAWTPENATTANYPRLTTNKSSVNSPTYYPSDYWLVNARYVRLKTVDIGYQFPTRVLPFKLNSARIYMSAYNLFTWDNYKKYQQDPEISTNTAGDAYINQRVVNLGLQISL
jgi:TonB-linked SusC/RagA family outer membrane protein